jgi:hypothetical protein
MPQPMPAHDTRALQACLARLEFTVPSVTLSSRAIILFEFPSHNEATISCSRGVNMYWKPVIFPLRQCAAVRVSLVVTSPSMSARSCTASVALVVINGTIASRGIPSCER